MNDKEQKYIEIAKKLLKKSEGYFVYTVISDSMNPLIRKGDKITVIKKDFDKLKKYQIIAFQNNTSGNENIPTVHRIIKKINNVKIVYKTKGDNALFADKEFVKKEQFIGVVDEIIKNKFNIKINSKTGKILSFFTYFLFCIKNFFKLLFLNIKNFFITVFQKEQKVICSDDLLILRQSIFTKISDWQKTIKNGVELIAPFINNDKNICDISFGGGYSEESFNFIRKGFNISYKSLSEDINNDFYDVIICSRVINIFENEQKRKDAYIVLKKSLTEKGVMLLSYINEKNNLLIKIKRNIYNFLYRNYDGPLSDDVVYDNRYFVMKSLSFKTVYKELQSLGFVIKYYKRSDNVINFLVSKK